MRFILLVLISAYTGQILHFRSISASTSTPLFAEELPRLKSALANSSNLAQDSCIADFPAAASTVFLPVVMGKEPEQSVTPPVAETRLSKQAGLLVPLGDQLGDVGQYYSQVAPSLRSTLKVRNITPITQTFTMTLYREKGTVALSLRNCAIAPLATLSVEAEVGAMHAVSHEQTLPLTTVCDPSSQLLDLADQQSGANLHGIYHAEITTYAQNALRVTVDTESDKSKPSILYDSAGHYQALPRSLAMRTIHIPAVVATRNTENWWDTELVVQNVTGYVTNVQFRFCDEGGHCFDNNQATLSAHERRSFLASHLLYANHNGFLEARAGWFSATVTASAVADTDDTSRVAVLSNIFQQPATEGPSPQAEQGSSCFVQAEPTPLSQQLNYSATVTNAFLLRIYNPSAEPNEVRVKLIDVSGRAQQSVSKTLAPAGSSTWGAQELFGKFLPARFEEVVSIHIQSSQEIVAFVWQEGHLLYAETTEEHETTWYAPMVAAPTVEFRWDDESAEDNTRLQFPGSNFGLAETESANHAQRPLWARKLNWYNWSKQEQFCNESVSNAEPYSTYIPMWWGLGSCTIPWDRSCVNSANRLYRIRNDLPSSCVGRPLFLANEPDLSPGQAFMTYPELGRLIYQLRSWPGELYSPVFASYAYDAPTYAEATEWCTNAVAQKLCPGTAGCETCTQDGSVNGEEDPLDISFKGLEEYFSSPGRWVQNQHWRFEDTIEGMLLHVYAFIEPYASNSYWRTPYLQQYRDRADEAGWPIIVSEYGFVHWHDQSNIFPNINTCTIAEHVDDLRQFLQTNLGNHEATHLNNPKKLFWFHTGCSSFSFYRSNELCLFQDAQTLTSPVGICWVEDTAQNGTEGTQCTERCPMLFLPFVEGKDN